MTVSINKHFVGFLAVDDTTGKGRCDSLLGHLDKLNVDIADCRGQSYDNGSNMCGPKQGVQKRALELNKNALYMPCSSHNLNLVIADADKLSVLSVSFFSVPQRLYTLFSSSVQRLSVLQENVTWLTVKQISATRWECCVDSVKVLRYQMKEVLNALAENAVGKRDGETASVSISLAKEIGSWTFIMSVIIQYDVLYEINRTNKLLQSPKIPFDMLKKET